MNWGNGEIREEPEQKKGWNVELAWWVVQQKPTGMFSFSLKAGAAQGCSSLTMYLGRLLFGFVWHRRWVRLVGDVLEEIQWVCLCVLSRAGQWYGLGSVFLQRANGSRRGRFGCCRFARVRERLTSEMGRESNHLHSLEVGAGQ